ncbi:hypothetical protein LAZ67_2006688, partial [Cordylochernes scorpioides]
MILIHSELWDYANSIRIKPETEVESAEWEKKNQKALATIVLSLSPSEIIHVKRCKTSAEVWKLLNEVPQPKGPATKVFLTKQLILLKMKPNQRMQDYLNKFSSLADKLSEMDAQVPEDFLSILLLCSLPESYEGFRTAIEIRDKLPSFETLKVKMLEEEIRQTELNGTTDSEEKVFLGNSERKPFSSTSKPMAKGFPFNCHFCGKKGHKAADCRKIKYKSPRTEMVASLGIECLNKLDANEWCLDSGATAHMCSTKKSFTYFEDTAPVKITLADGQFIEAIGKGNVKLDCQSNTGTVTLSLEDVLFVPRLNGNLFSIKGEGIGRQLSVEYTPQQNGVAERAYRTLVNMTRCFMIEGNLPETLWAELIHTSTYIRNRCPRHNDCKTPHELFTKRKPVVSHLKIIGSKSFAMNNRPNRSKFAPRGEEYKLIGYFSESKAYRLWKPGTRTIIKSRDVRFIEPELSKIRNEVVEIDVGSERVSFKEIPLVEERGSTSEIDPKAEIESQSDLEVSEVLNEPSESGVIISRRGSPRYIRTGKPSRPRKEYPTANLSTQEFSEVKYSPDPKDAEEALSGKDSYFWRKAMREEFDSLIENKTWELVDPPKGQNVIGSKWVFRRKYSSDGSLERHKARLVAKGFSQQYGIDYEETFAPVVRQSTIRVFFALAVEYNLIVHQMDVQSAYLNGEIKEEVYMAQPENFVSRKYPEKVCRLKKAIYGLKQAGIVWHGKLDTELKYLGLKQIQSDNCVYIKHHEGILLVAIYVDDLIIAAEREDTLISFKEMSTRPDIAYAVSALGQFSNDPRRQHWNAAKRVLRYLKGTLCLKITYEKTNETLYGYVDADWGGNLADRKSQTGLVFFLAGGPIAWETKKQQTVALSSTEFEYIALCEAGKEAVYLRALLDKMGFGELLNEPTVLKTDNQGAQQLSRNPVYHARTKHIDIKWHYIRSICSDGLIEVVHTPTQENVADILTKGLPRVLMQDYLNKFSSLADKLSEMDAQVPEDFLSILLLCSLPESYEGFRTAIETRDKLPNFETLKVKMLEEAIRQTELNGTTDSEEKVFFGNTERKPFSSTSKPKAKGFPFDCHFCGKKGHKAADCRKRKSRNPKTEMVASLGIECLNKLDANEWCLDGGATAHMCSTKKSFTYFEDTAPVKITLADGKFIEAIGKGNVKLDCKTNTGTVTLSLEDVLFVPRLNGNLFSISKCTSKFNIVNFKYRKAEIVNLHTKFCIQAYERNGLYILSQINCPKALATREICIAGEKNYEKWHSRFGHLNLQDLKKLKMQNIVYGLPIFDVKNFTCEVCLNGKQTRLPFQKESFTRAREPLELIHTDICGPMRTKSLGGALYFSTFIDDFSGFIFTFIMKSRSEVFKGFRIFKNYAEKQTGKRLKCIRSDNAPEYLSKEFKDYLEGEGIGRQLSVEYTPQQNGVAERANRTLLDMTRCFMIEGDLPETLWAELIHTSTFIRNRCPRNNDCKTPHELFTKRKPVVSHLKIIGSKSFAVNNRPNRSKFAPRSEEYKLIGYFTESKAYRLWKPGTRTIIKSRDVRFIEPELSKIRNEVVEIDVGSERASFKEIPLVEEKGSTSEAKSQTEIESESDLEMSDLVDEPSESEVVISRRGRGRPRYIRTGKPGRPRKEYPTANLSTQELLAAKYLPDPKDAEEALSGRDSYFWKKAMEEEFDSLIENKTWELVDPPKNRNIIGTKWVFKTKCNSDGSVERHKARLVAKGYSQQYGIDYEETFAPVVRQSTIRMFLALAVEYNLILHQMDVQSAYLNGEIKEEIFMTQPENFVSRKYPEKVCRLKKAIYGLKQAGIVWHEKLDNELKNLGLKQLQSDNCVYIKHDEGILLVAIYVDDLIIAAEREDTLKSFKESMKRIFKIKDLGGMNCSLGIRIQMKEDGSISIDQERYIEELLAKYRMKEAKPISTPMDSNSKLTKISSIEGENEPVKKVEYQSLIGSLIYLSVSTRPDIAYAVSALGQFSNDPRRQHWNAAKRVLRYLKGTSCLRITYRKSNEALHGYVDADWGGNLVDRKSHTGIVYFLARGPIAWESKKQQTVTLSSTESEYIALCEAGKEAVYLRALLDEMGFGELLNGPTVLKTDNQGAQRLARNPVYHARTKHIDIKWHYIRSICSDGLVEVVHTPTQENVADILTKGLP